MHLAYPPRKNSNAPRYMPRKTMQFPRIPRNKKTGIILGLFVLLGWWFFARSHSSSRGVPDHVPSGKPPVVIVTVIDTSNYPKEYTDTVILNREQYAKLHGYKTLIAKIGDYDLHGSPFSWTKVVAMRHAVTKFPDAKWIWYVDQDAFIMNPKLKLQNVLSDGDLTSVMIKDQPVVPPDSIIKTFSHLKGRDVDLILTQDDEGISLGSFAVRNGEWARFLLDTWYDPMYRSYNFQKAEVHAIEHILQWHPTLLSKLAFVPQKLINSYASIGNGKHFTDDDLVMRLDGCKSGEGDGSCDKEGGRIAQKWRTAFRNA